MGELLGKPNFPDRGTGFSGPLKLGSGEIREDGVIFTYL
jgi:hypothetical protein